MSSVVAERNGARLTLRARELRGDRSLVEAAALVGIRQDELSRIERGETSAMRFDTLLRLCEAYRVPPGELLSLEKDTAGTSPLEQVLAAVAAGTASVPAIHRYRLTRLTGARRRAPSVSTRSSSRGRRGRTNAALFASPGAGVMLR